MTHPPDPSNDAAQKAIGRDVKQSGGAFEARISRSLDLAAGVVFNAWAEAAQRAKWQRRGDFELVAADPPGSVSGRWLADGSRVEITVDARESGGCELAIVHAPVAGAGQVERMREFWKRSIDRMVEWIGRQS